MKTDIPTIGVANFLFSDVGLGVHAIPALKEGTYRELIARFHEIIDFVKGAPTMIWHKCVRRNQEISRRKSGSMFIIVQYLNLKR